MSQEFVKDALWYLKDQLISNSKRPVQLSCQAVDLFLELLSVGQNLQQSGHSVDDEGHYTWYTAHAESLKEQFIQKWKFSHHLLPSCWWKVKWSFIVHKTFVEIPSKQHGSVLLNNKSQLKMLDVGVIQVSIGPEISNWSEKMSFSPRCLCTAFRGGPG